MIELKNNEVWFVTGSQHLYGPETLNQVNQNSRKIVDELNKSKEFPFEIVFKNVVTTPESIYNVIQDANGNPNCTGLIFWMHTFSPAKMWINGLKILNKPFLHLHTQFNRDIPWESIDMDFMNLNQSAHGDREFGFICSKLNLNRKVVTGHWTDKNVRKKIEVWMRAAAGLADMKKLKVARFGDNMRDVAVTEGNKVNAQEKFGFSVYGFGIGDLVKYVDSIKENEITGLIEEYKKSYDINPIILNNENNLAKLKESAKIELGLQKFLADGNFNAFTTTFEDLHGLKQLPGLAVQRLMKEGFGFGAEGDWKTAAIVRAAKVMSGGLSGGTSFMEDYTYHLNPEGMKVLGAHMLEVCESIAGGKPKLEIHPLGIGGKDDPARLVFDVPPGSAVNASLIDLGNRFRFIVNDVEVVNADKNLEKFPVARALWIPKPNLEISATAWIYAGGAHHTVFTKSLTAKHFEDFAEMLGIEFLRIDDSTSIPDFKNQLRWNDVFYKN